MANHTLIYLDKFQVVAPDVAVLDQVGVHVELADPLALGDGSSGGGVVVGHSVAVRPVEEESLAASPSLIIKTG